MTTSAFDATLPSRQELPLQAPVVGVEPSRRSKAWVWVALAALVLAAGVLYGTGIKLGMVHNFYNPAVHSMSVSWRAFFWMGYDPAASITLDKLPLSFQVEALSARVFGFSTWSVLLPQVVEACLTIVAMFWVVRRWMGARSGLVAAAMYATTPIVAALAHAQITDTLLVLLLVIATHFLLKAVTTGRWTWLLLAGVFVGLAFQAKMAQAWGVLPAFALVYFMAAPPRWTKRLLQLAVTAVVTVAVSVWWLVAVSLVPASQRPWIDGSRTNSAWDMVFVYNLLGRYESGQGVQSPGGGVGQGWRYMVSNAITTQVGWFYPLATLGLLLGLVWRWRRPRTDPVRAGIVLFAVWFIVHAVAFSLGRVAHSFYVVAVAPAVVGLAVVAVKMAALAWRAGGWRRGLAPSALGLQIGWAVWLQHQFPDFRAWSIPLTIGLGAGALVLLALSWGVARRARGLARWLQGVAAVVSVGAVLAIPATWAASTIEQGYSGSTIGPAAGPSQGGGGFGGAGGGQSGQGTAQTPTRDDGQRPPFGQAPSGVAGSPDQVGGGSATGSAARVGEGAGGGGVGGSVDSTVAEWLQSHEPGSKYLVAIPGSQAAGPWLLAGYDVLPMGGFTGSIGYPSVPELQKLISADDLRYVMLGGGMGGGAMGSSGASALNTWVQANCTEVTDSAVSSAQIYDCQA
ncbi:glycosyltransferase family 39 protein [Aestuariimicrobium kwangyangense]|uniref:glycosyltransferase family 39 protein n=1 Tax=Aestuariimicrobium kwangyangense TaxID=396389 RepID=UPI0003B5026A|nr:glycosyltransferase family 39 protein [Aestuariimicrobium kwangyangense]